MDDTLLVVDGFAATDDDDINLRDDAFSLALDQRVFGPRKLLAFFGERDGTMRHLAFTDRTSPPELALACCVDHLGAGAEVALALHDEPVTWGPAPADLARRFERFQAVTAARGIHLVDWIACDDQLFRSYRIALAPDEEWWAVP